LRIQPLDDPRVGSHCVTVADAPSVIYEDENFLALHKPAGLLVHARSVASENAEPTVVSWLRERYPQILGVGDDPRLRPGIVHRLDRETSGILLASKNQPTFAFLKRLFQEREIRKIYYAVVYGRVLKLHDVIDKPIGLLHDTVRRSVRGMAMVKSARTEYWFLGHSAWPNGSPISFLRIAPHTGRTHQIRVHCSSMGHPIVGDRLYGKNVRLRPSPARLLLHAFSLEFTTATGLRLVLEDPPPADFLYAQAFVVS
jgi:23S rRNA pseudouridine1911/1915/1917 synthase